MRRWGVVTTNVQKQLQGLGITFKPCGARKRISHQTPDLDEMELRRATASIATEIGNMEHTFILEAWGSHSVFVRGPFLASIHNAIEMHGGGRIRVLDDIHVELIPRLRRGEVYVPVPPTESSGERAPEVG